MGPTPYPLTLRREALVDAGACPQGIADFATAAPNGVLIIPDVTTHVALLSTPLARWEAWAIYASLLPPIHATAGAYGRATAGDHGMLTIDYRAGGRLRRAVAYVGEGGILPDVAYRLDSAGRFVPA